MPDFNSNVKKYADAWLSQLEKFTDEQKSQIRDLEALKTALSALKARTEEEYAKKGTDKRLTDESFKTLSDAYMKVGMLCEKYFDSTLLMSEEMDEVSDFFHGMSAGLAEDMDALQQYKNSKEVVSFQTLIDRGHTPEITIKNAKITDVGGCLSSRLVFHYKRPDGRDINGVFTKKSVFEPAEIENEKNAKDAESHARAAALIDDLYPAFLEAANVADGKEGLKKFYGYFAFSNSGSKNHEKLKSFTNILVAMYKKHPDRYPGKLQMLERFTGDANALNSEFRAFQFRCGDYSKLPADQVPSVAEARKRAEEKRKFIQDLFDQAYPRYLEFCKKSGKAVKDSLTTRKNFYKGYAVEEHNRTMIENALEQFLKNTKLHLRYTGHKEIADQIDQMDLENDMEFEIMGRNYVANCSYWENKLGMTGEVAAIEGGSRIDTRNTGMSIVADMLEKPELIARAKPLKVNLNGEKLEGTFMALGKGEDLDRLKGKQDFKKYTRKNFATDGLRSMSDLMIIDYICGNVDRHAGNMLYQFDMTGKKSADHRFMGIQGIDNDESFGSFDPELDADGRARFPYIQDIPVISESMAKKIEAMDPHELRFRLRAQGLSDQQLQYAETRLKQVKTAIREGRTYYETVAAPKVRKDKNYFQEGHLRTIPDAEFKNLNLQKLADVKQHAYFGVLNTFAKQIRDEDLKKDKMTPEVVNKTDVQHITTEDLEKVNRRLEEMKAATRNNKTSPEFEALRESLQKYRDFCTQHENTALDEPNCKEKARLLYKISMYAIKYLDHKKNEFWHSSYAEKRIRLASDIEKECTPLYESAASDAYKIIDDPELQAQIDEYNERSMELLETRTGEMKKPGANVEIEEGQLQVKGAENEKHEEAKKEEEKKEERKENPAVLET